MPKRHIGTKLTIDGEREYKKSIQSINSGLRTLNTQMSAVTAQYKDNGDSVEALNTKSSLLNQQYEEQRKKLETLEKAHKNALDQVGEEDKRTQKWAQSVNIAKKRLIELERQIGEVERNLDPLNRAIKENENAAKSSSVKIEGLQSELRALDAQYANNKDAAEYLTKKQKILDDQYNESVNKVKALEKALKSVEQQSGKNSDEYIRMESSLNGARAEMYSAENATGELTNQSRGLGDEINDVASKFGIQLPEGITDAINSFGKFDRQSDGTATKSVDNMGSIQSAIGGISLPVAGVIAAIAAIAAEAAKTALAVEESTTRMKVALDLTGKEAEAAEDAVTDVYVNAIVENRDEAEAAVVSVMKFMEATGDQATWLADKLVVIKEAFGKDYVETARTASTMMENFGISGGEALDIIVTGLQTSADKNGDLLDVLNEYSPSFERLGDDAQAFLTRVVKATDAGAYSADKAADAYKEFYNKAAGQDETFMDALDSLGFHADTVISELLSGGDRANIALEDVVSRLEGVSSTAEQSKIASSLFGSQWEDVGTKAILAMNNIEEQIIDTSGAAGEALDTMVSTTKKTFKGFWRWFTSSEEATNIHKDIISMFSGTGYRSGQALMNGFTKGIDDNKQEAVDATVTSAEEISDAADKTLDINSPSGVFEKKAEMSMLGYGGGMIKAIAKTQRQVRAAMNAMAEVVPTSGMALSAHNPNYSASGNKQAQCGGDTFYITIDAKNVKDFNTVVDIVNNARRARRSGSGRR